METLWDYILFGSIAVVLFGFVGFVLYTSIDNADRDPHLDCNKICLESHMKWTGEKTITDCGLETCTCERL